MMSPSVGEEHAVREIANERSPSAFFNSRKLKRILQESREVLIDLRLKAETEVSTLALVSKRRLEDLRARPQTRRRAATFTVECRGGPAALRGLQTTGGKSFRRDGGLRGVRRRPPGASQAPGPPRDARRNDPRAPGCIRVFGPATARSKPGGGSAGCAITRVYRHATASRAGLPSRQICRRGRGFRCRSRML